MIKFYNSVKAMFGTMVALGHDMNNTATQVFSTNH